jgi:hypothetical protein
VLDRYRDNPYRPSPTQLRQSWSGIVRDGDRRTFTTILLPHRPAFDVTPFAGWAKFLRDDDDTTLVRVTTESDDRNRLQRTHWVLLQERPEAVSAEGFRSNAQLAVLSTDHRGQLQPGVLADGSTLSWNGEDQSSNARKHEVASLYEVTE